MNLAAGEIGFRQHGGRVLARDDDIFDSTHRRRGEVDDFAAQVGDGERADRDVAVAFGQSRQQAVARRRNDHDLRPHARSGDERQLALELAQRFVGNAFLLGAVQVVQRAAVRHEHAQEAALGEIVVVPGPTLVHIEDVGCGEVLKRPGIRGRVRALERRLDVRRLLLRCGSGVGCAST